jgi:hypothetical protein
MQLREIYSPTLQFETPFYTKDEVISWFESYNLNDYLTQDEINVINERGTWNKHKLATKIVNHYFMREIGFETIGLFREKSKIFMEEIMEEYLPLIYSASIEYDPLVNVDYTESYNREATNEGSSSNSNQESNTTSNQASTTNTSQGVSNSSSSNSSSGLTINNDTPQGQISKTNILNGTYASSTSANENSISIQDETTSASNGSSSNTSTGTSSNTSSGSSSNENTLNEEYTKRVKGNSGVSATAQKMIEQYRNNIRAIDREIIEKCNVLFMGLF